MGVMQIGFFQCPCSCGTCMDMGHCSDCPITKLEKEFNIGMYGILGTWIKDSSCKRKGFNNGMREATKEEIKDMKKCWVELIKKWSIN